MDITSYLLGKKASGGGGGGSKSEYTGHYDAEGLAQIGWTEEDIKYYQDNAVCWNEEQDDDFKLTNAEIEGTVTKSETRFLKKSSTLSSVKSYPSLIALPLININATTDWSQMFRECPNLLTIPLFNTSNVTVMENMFTGCFNLTKIPLINTGNVTHTKNMFNTCYNLKEVPLLNMRNVTNANNMFAYCYSLHYIPQFDTSNLVYMTSMFMNCVSLTAIPVLNTSKVEGMQNAFSSCYNLSKKSLDNILQMCINATSYTGTKTLAYIGISSTYYPSSLIQTLPHYQDFINAGWTIGY